MQDQFSVDVWKVKSISSKHKQLESVLKKPKKQHKNC